MPTPTEQINAILLSGKRAKTKEEQDKIIKMLSALSTDYSNAEYPKMSISEFSSSDAQKAALSPEEMLKSYYGENLSKQIIDAGNYNIARRTIAPSQYANIFDKVRAKKDKDGESLYSFGLFQIPTIQLATGNDKDNAKRNREYLKSDDPEWRNIGLDYFKTNSLDPSAPSSTQQSVLEHEIGHHITMNTSSDDSLPSSANKNAYHATNGFKEFGLHTGAPMETTQALGRFQREMFKNTGKRLHPVEFIKLVNKGEIPDFLTQEGRRILIYAKNLKKVADESKDKKKKEAAEEALWNISRMAPAVVQNKKQNGLNLPIG